MNISIYIADLLEEHDYVIIPGLGALIASYRPARFADDNTILPPSRQVSFNPEMKINDGLLAGYIARQQKVTSLQAQKLLDQYIGDLFYQLDHDGKIVFDRIGTLSCKEGAYLFIPDPSAGRNPRAFGLDPVTVATGQKSGHEPVLPQKKPGKKGLPSWARLLKIPMAIFIVLLVYFVAFYHKPETKLPKTAKQTDTMTHGQSKAKVPAHSVQVTQTENPSSPAGNNLNHTGKASYYIVSGSFKSQQFADEYFIEMTNKGFNPTRLGPIDGFWMVVLDSLSTEKEATAAANRITEKDPSIDLWVFHRKK